MCPELLKYLLLLLKSMLLGDEEGSAHNADNP
jgi:hypothetical protein